MVEVLNPLPKRQQLQSYKYPYIWNGVVRNASVSNQNTIDLLGVKRTIHELSWSISTTLGSLVQSSTSFFPPFPVGFGQVHVNLTHAMRERKLQCEENGWNLRGCFLFFSFFFQLKQLSHSFVILHMLCFDVWHGMFAWVFSFKKYVLIVKMFF